MKIFNKSYDINSDLNKKIILISDLHYKNKNDINRLNNIIEGVKHLNPDYICIPGDLMDKSNIEESNLLLDFLELLSKISKVFISIGNHEFYIDKKNKVFGLNKEFLDKVKKINNVYLLDNDNVVIDNINFIGVTVPIEYYDSKTNYISEVNGNKKYYNVLLCHNPLNVLKDNLKVNNIDLVLCGHMHGGVVLNIMRSIFKTRGLIGPDKKLFPKYAYGKFKIDNYNVIITSGCRVLPFKTLNWLFSAEIVTINLKNNIILSGDFNGRKYT